MKKNEAPEYSIGDMNGMMAVRIDSGKYMDTKYVYDNIDFDQSTKAVVYTIKLIEVIINGVLRDKVELENGIVDNFKQDFVDEVTDPVLFHVVQMMKENPPSTGEAPAPSIILH